MTPEEVVAAIIVEFQKTIVPGFYVNYTHNIFRVYLDSENFTALRPFQGRIREEAMMALREQLKLMNGGMEGRRGLGLLNWPSNKQSSKRHEAVGDWIVEFFQNEDDDASRHKLLVCSAGSIPSEEGVLQGPATVKVEYGPEAAQGGTIRSLGGVRSPVNAKIYATLSYKDDSGGHMFNIVKEYTKVGRGGPDNWVDLQLLTLKDISKEHFQIRCDNIGRKFFIKDLSRFGTWVDGVRVPPSVDVKNGVESDKNIEVALPPRAQITLADVLSMDFKALLTK